MARPVKEKTEDKAVTELQQKLTNALAALVKEKEAAATFKREILHELTVCNEHMRFHVESVLKTTGSITLTDVLYCQELGERIIDKKFNSANGK